MLDHAASSLVSPPVGRLVWIDGQLHHPATATVSATDHGLVVGNGVFEATKITASGAYAVTRHLDRLSRSAAALGLPAPDHDRIRAGIDAVVAARDFENGKLRITYTGGAGPLGSQFAYGPATVVVAADPTVPPPAVGALATTPWTRNERGAMAGVKTTSYAENVRALAWATGRGATEALFLNTVGHVCEGTGTNVFFVLGDEVVTPPLSAGPLAGVTRALLLDWAPITERDLTLAEAQAADEVFITSSLRDLQPVDRWDEHDYPAPGRVTERLMSLFARRSADDLDP